MDIRVSRNKKVMCEKEPFWAKKDKDKWLQLNFNINFLKKMNNIHNGLHCEYCGKKNLKIYEWCQKINESDVATVDHFYPKSRYNELRMDEKNFIVSCYSCNNMKKDHLWEIDDVKFPINRVKINELRIIV